MPIFLARSGYPRASFPTRSRYKPPALLRWWHVASCDAPTVAVVWTLSFARAAGVRLPLWVPLLVALGTWWVYVADRVLDARRAMLSGSAETLRERHFFHWRYRRVLVPAAACAVIVSAAIVCSRMSASVREHDSVLAIAALAYFSGVHVPGQRPQWVGQLWSKELLVGILFTAGCAAPTLTRLRAISGDHTAIILLVLAMGCYAALAWLNCLAIDRWESARAFDVAWPAGLIAAGAILLALASAPRDMGLALLSAACAASALLLGLLHRQRDRLTPLASRCAADLVLLTPLICLMR